MPVWIDGKLAPLAGDAASRLREAVESLEQHGGAAITSCLVPKVSVTAE